MSSAQPVEDYSHLSARGQALVAAFRAALVDHVAAAQPRTILEVGCGQGWLARGILDSLHGVTYQGVDIREDVVAFARDLVPEAEFVTGNAEELPFGDSSFDLIVCAEVLEHLPDPTLSLAEISRVGNGWDVYSVPHEPWFWLVNLARGKYLATLGNHPDHVQHWSAGGLRHLLLERYDTVTVERSFPWLIAEARNR